MRSGLEHTQPTDREADALDTLTLCYLGRETLLASRHMSGNATSSFVRFARIKYLQEKNKLSCFSVVAENGLEEIMKFMCKGELLTSLYITQSHVQLFDTS